MRLSINSKYYLALLTQVEQEDITSLFVEGNGLYICNYQEQAWYDANGFNRGTNYSIEKKTKFYRLLNTPLKILSPTQDEQIKCPSSKLVTDHARHFSSFKLKGRLAQVSFLLGIISWMVKNKSRFRYVLCYNFTPIEIFSGLFAKRVLGKKCIVDFEDDYLLTSDQKLYPYYFKLVSKIPDAVICIHRSMFKYFPNQEKRVFNGFINLDYTKRMQVELVDGMSFLYSGALDDIRGADLIPEVIQCLRSKITDFKLVVTGSGPLEDTIRNWNMPEVDFRGFLSTSEYEVALSEADICFVLQKPDHPFSQGSFPSKCEFYAKHQKPILLLKLEQ